MMLDPWKAKKQASVNKQFTSSSTIKTIAQLSFSREEDSRLQPNNSQFLILKILKLERQLYQTSLENQEFRSKHSNLETTLQDKKHKLASIIKQNRLKLSNQRAEKDSIGSRDSLVLEESFRQHPRNHVRSNSNYMVKLNQSPKSKQQDRYYSIINSPEKLDRNRATQINGYQFKRSNFNPRSTDLQCFRQTGFIKANNQSDRQAHLQSLNPSKLDQSANRRKEINDSHTVGNIRKTIANVQAHPVRRHRNTHSSLIDQIWNQTNQSFANSKNTSDRHSQLSQGNFTTSKGRAKESLKSATKTAFPTSYLT